MVVVRPWKFDPATMISAVPSGTPFTRYAHLRATFSADSTASAPEFIGSTMSVPVSSASSWQNRPSWSWWNARLVSVTRPSCATAASTSPGCRWPKLSAEYPARKSRYRFPCHVGDPRAFGLGDDDRQRVVVVRAPSLVERDEVCRR